MIWNIFQEKSTPCVFPCYLQLSWSIVKDEDFLNDIQSQGKKFKTSTYEERKAEDQ